MNEVTVRLALIIAVATMGLALEGARAEKTQRATDGGELGVTIIGAISQQNRADNVALIKETESGAVRAVKMGHKLLSDWQVEEVDLKYIVISRKGERVLVYQDKFAAEFKSAPTAVASSPSVVPNSGEFFARKSTYREDGFERKAGQIDMSAGFRDKIVSQDLARILMEATAEPYMGSNGAIQGFQLTQIEAGSIFDKAGIVDNDVITAINGRPLNNIAGAVTLLKSLKNEDAIAVEIQRGGSSVRIDMRVH